MRLRASLQLVVLVPAFGLLLIAGITLHFLVLKTVSSYADASIRSNLDSLLVNVVTIADSEVDRQNREGKVDDLKVADQHQLNARMQFEDFAREHEVGLIVIAGGMPDFITGMPEPDASHIVKGIPTGNAGRIDVPAGERYYLSAATFAPWNWRLVLAKDARNFDALVGQVRAIYVGSAVGLAVIAGLLVLWLRQMLVLPIYGIAREFSEGHPPRYRGVKELEHLSGSISAMLQSLQAKSLHLETTLQSMTDGIVVFDAEMRLVAWNQHYVEFFHYPQGFVRPGMRFSEIIHFNVIRGDYGPGNAEAQLEEIVERARSLTPPRFEIDRADGRTVEVRRAPMPDGGFVTTYADITDRKQRMWFEAANEAKSQFLQNMSHDLRKPIAAIIEDARLILADYGQTLPADVRTAYANIDANSGHLLAMIDELLEMSRIEAGQVTVRPRYFTVQTLLDEVLRVIEPPARAKGLDVKIDGDGSVQAHTDPQLLSRVVMNLASNAVEYTACGNIRISARHHSGSLKIDVADTGPGIPKDKRDIIFEKFQRLEPTAGLTKPGMGLGLGLAISREFALLLGGRLEVTSETGKGSVFSLTVPVEFDEKRM
jgi:signal transduction histidine kinase